MSLLRKAYGSMEAPRYDFVGAALSSGVYDNVAKRLSQIGAVAELTDSNTDVSRSFQVSTDGEVRFLWLSLVGPFACLLRQSGPDVEVVDTLDHQVDRSIADLCSKSDLTLLGKQMLETRVGLKLMDVTLEDVRVFHALFADVELLPWKT